MTPVFHAAFVHYYESVLAQIEGAFGRRRSHWHTWPDVVRFGMVVRDAFTHGGTLEIRDPKAPPVTWRRLVYSYSANGRVLLYHDLHPADLIVLMEEMDDEIPR
jgi:hypothetical protein